MASKSNIAFLAAAIAGGLVITYFARSNTPMQSVSVKVPNLSTEARAGRAVFNANCAKCHGTNAGGTDKGPPLIHAYYRPGHHADIAFQRAAKFGVKAHHWQFGNMPPVKGVTEDQVARVITYVREIQRANGIK